MLMGMNSASGMIARTGLRCVNDDEVHTIRRPTVLDDRRLRIETKQKDTAVPKCSIVKTNMHDN